MPKVVCKRYPLNLGKFSGALYHDSCLRSISFRKKDYALEKYHASYRRCLVCIMVNNTTYNLTMWNQRMCKVFWSLNIYYSLKVRACLVCGAARHTTPKLRRPNWPPQLRPEKCGWRRWLRPDTKHALNLQDYRGLRAKTRDGGLIS